MKRQVMAASTFLLGATACSASGDPRHDTGGWNGLRFSFGREGRDDKQYDLAAADLRASVEVSRSQTLLLNPGQSLRFEARKKTDLGTGNYPSRLEYSSIVNPDDDPNFVGGILRLEPGPLLVRRGR
jgi:hypothetical protein